MARSFLGVLNQTLLLYKVIGEGDIDINYQKPKGLTMAMTKQRVREIREQSQAKVLGLLEEMCRQI